MQKEGQDNHGFFPVKQLSELLTSMNEMPRFCSELGWHLIFLLLFVSVPSINSILCCAYHKKVKKHKGIQAFIITITVTENHFFSVNQLYTHEELGMIEQSFESSPHPDASLETHDACNGRRVLLYVTCQVQPSSVPSFGPFSTCTT